MMSLCSTNTGSEFRNDGSKFAPRKRTRADYNGSEDGNGDGTATPRNGGLMEASAWGNGTADDQSSGWGAASPSPFVNTRYQLAGGLDTPGMAAARQAEESESIYADAGYRRSLGDGERPIEIDNYKRRGLWSQHEGPSYFPDELGRDENGRGRYAGYAASPRGAGWSAAAFNVAGAVAGAVVGKVWDFCKTTGAVFTGFRAGSGTGYKVSGNSATFQAVDDNDFWEEKNEDEREDTPLPGQYPGEPLEFIPDYMDRASRESTPPRPAKRRQVSSNNTDELGKNWVVVPPAPTKPPAQPTPSKARNPMIRGPARYSMPTASSGRRTAFGSAPRPASRANSGFGAISSTPRRPILASHASNTSSRLSHAGSPALNRSQGASYASPRGSPNSKIPRPTTPSRGARPGGAPGSAVLSPLTHGITESPAAKEAKRWAAMKRKEDREADESIRRLDAQLKAMIREGKEALGTKIEVSIEDDPGFGSRGTKKWAF